jgi:hypothetical protein
MILPNFPVPGEADSPPSPIAALDSRTFSLAITPNTGKPYSYVWWVVSFQLFCMNYARIAMQKRPAQRAGALALHTVLTLSTFLLTEEVLNAPYGVYGMTHNEDGTAAAASTEGYNSNGLFLLFAGLVICSVANAGTLTVLAEYDKPPAVVVRDEDDEEAAVRAAVDMSAAEAVLAAAVEVARARAPPPRPARANTRTTSVERASAGRPRQQQRV